MHHLFLRSEKKMGGLSEKAATMSTQTGESEKVIHVGNRCPMPTDKKFLAFAKKGGGHH